MTDGQLPDAMYTVKDVRDSREVSAFIDYRDEWNNRPYAEFNCPSCDYSIPAGDLVMEGGAQCPGCDRTVRLHITSHEAGGWRNIPENQQEANR